MGFVVVTVVFVAAGFVAAGLGLTTTAAALGVAIRAAGLGFEEPNETPGDFVGGGDATATSFCRNRSRPARVHAQKASTIAAKRRGRAATAATACCATGMATAYAVLAHEPHCCTTEAESDLTVSATLPARILHCADARAASARTHSPRVIGTGAAAMARSATGTLTRLSRATAKCLATAALKAAVGVHCESIKRTTLIPEFFDFICCRFASAQQFKFAKSADPHRPEITRARFSRRCSLRASLSTRSPLKCRATV